jgi:16S rRNA (guanine(966)-N(2))-methyltransferase RsmD
MRIIAGKYRGRVLKSPSDYKTRPTSDRLRESLFNIINFRISDDTNFLDLCAGTGACGIEAISRGAEECFFVEISRKMCAVIEQNLDNLKIPEDQTDIFCESAEKFLEKTSKSFDIIYYDPPYQTDYSKVLNLIADNDKNLLAEDGLLIVEHSKQNNLPDLIKELRRWRLLKQGDSCLSFYERN